MKDIYLSNDKIKIGKKIVGGVGGDVLFYVSDLGKLGLPIKEGILKIFVKQGSNKKEPSELKIHSKISNRPKLKHYIPKVYWQVYIQ